MKIAVPTRGERVDDHFGHCDHYTIFTIEDNNITNRETMASPQGCGCKSGIAADLQELGVVMMLAGNMGEGAKNKLNAHNIDVIRGCSGNVDELVKSYLEGKIVDSGMGCTEHECGDKTDKIDAHNIKLKI
ncbi:MAG: NifB/NifX family molybdenum-iron cluster-binding protein [Bacteroidales bacterium]|nr:NifB/NifX family molybdenum-iron cluster-binding protein [Bacteroidales bacterium]